MAARRNVHVDQSSASQDADAVAADIAARVAADKGGGQRCKVLLIFAIAVMAVPLFSSSGAGAGAGMGVGERATNQQARQSPPLNSVDEKCSRKLKTCQERLTICLKTQSCAKSLLVGCENLARLCKGKMSGRIAQGGDSEHAGAAVAVAEEGSETMGGRVERSGLCEERGRYFEGAARHCVCPVLYPGAMCSTPAHEQTCTCSQPANTVDFVPEANPANMVPRTHPSAFSGPITLNLEDWKQAMEAAKSSNLKPGELAGRGVGPNGVLRVNLPGKASSWRRIGKVGHELQELMPRQDLVGRQLHRTCAVVASSGILLLLENGAEIDAHDVVIRFNGAATAGFEKHVGSRTSIRIVNSKWTDFREDPSEVVLSHMRGPQSLTDYQRKLVNDTSVSNNFALFSPEFVNYLAQNAFEISQGYKTVKGFAGGDYTPTGGWTGLVLAMNICSQIDMYGFHVSEAHGVPYHYHNRCPQPYAARDDAEWLMVKSFAERGLARFREPCVLECHVSKAACKQCQNENPIPAETRNAGMAKWRTGPMPDYCNDRIKTLAGDAKKGMCEGICGTFEKKSVWGSSKAPKH